MVIVVIAMVIVVITIVFAFAVACSSKSYGTHQPKHMYTTTNDLERMGYNNC